MILHRHSIWHPFADDSLKPLLIKNAKGARVFDEQGNSYLDLISSWWVNLHGHSDNRLADVISSQARKLDHIIFADCVHEPAINLCEKLCSVLPAFLCKFFFSDNGSTSVEVALKMAFQFWKNKGVNNRDKFLCFDGGYHGDTVGCMSLSGNSNFHTKFRSLMFDAKFIPFPFTWKCDAKSRDKEDECLKVLDTYLNDFGDRVAMIIMEPLIQGAAGMRTCSAEFINKVVRKVREYDIIVIFDEVMTGFYRTGKFFALDHLEEDSAPDILCLSKGLTGGVLPMSITVTSQNVYNVLCRVQSKKERFLHGHSYTANPICCAVASKSFDILMSKETQNSIMNIQKNNQIILDTLSSKFENKIKALRSLGTIVAFNLESEVCDYFYEKSELIKKDFLSSGLILRPLGNVIYLLPPYCISASDLSEALEKIVEVLSSYFIKIE